MKKQMTSFRFFPQLNGEPDLAWAASRTKITEAIAQRFFASDSLQDKLVRAIAAEQVIPIKEVLECFEFVAHVRKTVRAECIADMCCGHGLVGMLIGIFEKQVKTVRCIDKKKPMSFDKLLISLTAVAPWIEEKVTFETSRLENVTALPHTCSIVSAHACGLLTDACIDAAIATKGHVALLPCCYPKRLCAAPHAIAQEFGEEIAFDIDRTYRLESAGYRVKWSGIPECITPMNRVIVAKKQ